MESNTHTHRSPLLVLHPGSPAEKLVLFWRKASNQDTRESGRGTRALENRGTECKPEWEPSMSTSLPGFYGASSKLNPLLTKVTYSHLERLNVQKILNRVWRLESSTRWSTPSKIPPQWRPLVNNHHPHTNHCK